MAASNFDKILRETWRHEGGYSDHPSDSGGATKYGITIGTLSDWRKRPVSKAEVQALTRDEAAAIYKAWYWTPVRGDDLPAGLDAVAFDGAVNSGVSRSAKWLQGALGVAQDGKIGTATLAAARAADPAAVIARALDARLAFLKAAKNSKTRKLLWPTFGKGWQRRVDEVRAFAAHLAQEPVASSRPSPKPIIMPSDPVPAVPAASLPPAAWAAIAVGLLIAAALIFGG